MLGESLDDSTADHDERTKHNGPSSTESLSKPRCKWDRKDRAELVGRVDKAEQTGFDGPLVFRILSSVTEIYYKPVSSEPILARFCRRFVQWWKF